MEAARLVQLFNEHFGQGTVSLPYVLDEMPNDAYEAWWAYFIARGKRAALEKEQAEHDATMDAVSRALKPH